MSIACGYKYIESFRNKKDKSTKFCIYNNQYAKVSFFNIIAIYGYALSPAILCDLKQILKKLISLSKRNLSISLFNSSYDSNLQPRKYFLNDWIAKGCWGPGRDYMVNSAFAQNLML